MERRRTKKEIVKMLLRNSELEEQDEEVDKQEEAKMTRGDRIADKISEIAGSWTFIILFVVFLLGWIGLNTIILTEEQAIDPYPFILLNLVLSCIAALQAPIIMMSQNRQAEKDSLRNQNDYRTDLKSELILESLHDQMTSILKNQKQILKYIKSQEEEKNDSKKNT